MTTLPSPDLSLLTHYLLQDPVKVCDVALFAESVASFDALLDTGAARLTGFRANAGDCDTLNRQRLNIAQFHPYICGTGQPMKLYQLANAFYSGYAPPDFSTIRHFHKAADVLQQQAVHDLPTIQLDSVDGIDTIDVLKIECLSGQTDILFHAQKALHSCTFIIVQACLIPVFKGPCLLSDIATMLARHAFIMIDFPKTGMTSFGSKPKEIVEQSQTIFTTAVFCKRHDRLETLDDAKLTKMVALADCLNRKDMAHFVLSLLDQRRGTQLADHYTEQYEAAPDAPMTLFNQHRIAA